MLTILAAGTTVAITSADAPVSLPEVLFAYWAPDRDVHPR